MRLSMVCSDKREYYQKPSLRLRRHQLLAQGAKHLIRLIVKVGAVQFVE
jgi:hypothetical protein